MIAQQAHNDNNTNSSNHNTNGTHSFVIMDGSILCLIAVCLPQFQRGLPQSQIQGNDQGRGE